MRKLVRTGRIAALFLLFAVVILIYVAKLYQLQIRDGGTGEDIISTYTVNEIIPSGRGDILDRNGKLLVSGESSYYITLSRSALIEREDINDILLELAYTAAEYGVSYNDTFPVTLGAPFSYIADPTNQQSYVLGKYFEFFDLDPEISASDFIIWLKDHYKIDYTMSISDARVVIGLRYEMETRVIVNIDEYVFTNNATTDFISVLEERGFPGVNVEISTSRVYHTQYAAHILGYVGKMNAEEYEYYKTLDYPMDAVIGKDGVEKAFEEYLHGADGRQKVTYSEETGAVVSREVVKEAKPGQNVYLSIDIDVQAATEHALENKILNINAEREVGDKITGGAVVVELVKTGEVLAMTSYPTFDIETFFENYSILLSDSTSPLFNRATQGTYNPGSTFKMVTGYTGLITGKYTPEDTIFDDGAYREYAESDNFAPKCWIYPTTGAGHGSMNLVDAIQNSCNVYFYTVGDIVGIDAMAASAKEFGFGATTGIEIGDSPGNLATREYKKEVLGENWFAADDVYTAIGQGHNMFTPVQLANYASTIANGGTLHKLTLLNSVKSADYTTTVYKNDTEVLHEFSPEGKEYLGYLRTGMEAVAKYGTARNTFGSFIVDGKEILVACKTGTVQSDNSETNNGIFVCYAPADDPEIAISIVVEKGGSGAEIMGIARDVMEYYFGNRTEYITVPGENTLIP
ncbi:MAG: hypothetical protein IJ017_02140 [Oscillospiraceae bacterium]|nr:hypothetical protein [Oscillospiraceae bacterium]